VIKAMLVKYFNDSLTTWRLLVSESLCSIPKIVHKNSLARGRY